MQYTIIKLSSLRGFIKTLETEINSIVTSSKCCDVTVLESLLWTAEREYHKLINIK